MMQLAQPVLKASGLAVGYRMRGGGRREVLSQLELELREGEFVCLLGPNGSGKSTLIRALAGLEAPLLGEIQAQGQALSRFSPRDKARLISVVLTDSLPMGAVTGRSVVALGRHPHTGWTGSLSRRDRERIEWAMDAVGAASLADRQVGEMSDGERQKIMLARALAQEAPIMLLDEPTAFLDLPRRVELMRTLRELSLRDGLSVLLSTHDLDLALRSADALWLVGGDGRATVGAPEELALNGALASAFASENLDWDEEQGSFRLHRDPCSQAHLEGEGAAKVWTGRALQRIGYGVVSEGSSAAVWVSVEQAAGDRLRWQARKGGFQRSFASLDGLLRFLKTSSGASETSGA